MTTTEQSNPTPAPRQTQPSGLRKGIVAGAVALTIAAGGGGVVHASGNSASSSEVGQAPAGAGDPLIGDPLISDLLHGEVQRGTVTAVTDTSLTARSSDGYSRTYVIDAGTAFGSPGAPVEGDAVTVVAETEGGTATAVRVFETTQ
ncbi:hypothetical protein [Saccharothrix coeruleofusca]|uniref:DUF5666 domain-containing protein n=1 Tax=Saccharothrix coeruleofusca TaxID=33919 RepID=A0A918APA6_9PSEU|nr:hypothetical protein [Saccharothrix coeruleofusca]GGP64764.1 hypothetical protein GCM10010185_41660 [Saccharothrix coeruleofusca]